MAASNEGSHHIRRVMGLDQIGIALSGVIAIWLTQTSVQLCVGGRVCSDARPALLVLRGMEGGAVGHFRHVHALHLRLGERPMDPMAQSLPSRQGAAEPGTAALAGTQLKRQAWPPLRAAVISAGIIAF